MKATKTRMAYGYLKTTGELIASWDLLNEALKVNMMIRDFEKKLIAANPQLEFKIIVE